jgi:hypothetical protein
MKVYNRYSQLGEKSSACPEYGGSRFLLCLCVFTRLCDIKSHQPMIFILYTIRAVDIITFSD